MGTKRHQTTNAVYQFLWNYQQDHGFVPTQQEIAAQCFLAQSSVSRHLDKLAKWGWLSREEGRARGIRLLKTPSSAEKSDKIIR
ncbi:MAG: MarR family transcriptional regulator [Anaerolineae bacterium]|nr:MarR family transcriptional regulator [Anaerolineae bacterium]